MAPDQELVVREIAAVDSKIQWYQRTLARIAALQYVLCMQAPDWIAPKVNVQVPRDLSLTTQMTSGCVKIHVYANGSFVERGPHRLSAFSPGRCVCPGRWPSRLQEGVVFAFELLQHSARGAGPLRLLVGTPTASGLLRSPALAARGCLEDVRAGGALRRLRAGGLGCDSARSTSSRRSCTS